MVTRRRFIWRGRKNDLVLDIQYKYIEYKVIFSSPPNKSPPCHQRELVFSTDASVGDTRPAFSSLASQIVNTKVYKEVGRLAKDSNAVKFGNKAERKGRVRDLSGKLI